MSLGCLVLVLLCCVPVFGQWYNTCLSTNFNCVILRVKGIGFDDGVTYEVITEIFNYDAKRQIIVRDISGYSYGELSTPIVSERDIYDYKKKLQYRIVRPQYKQETCNVLSYTTQFKNECIPDGGQEIWLKSPLGYNGDMVPTIRFKWVKDNSTTELMWTYTGQPVTQTQYGLWNDGDGGQEIWLKSPLGYNGDMVPTIRFKWVKDNSTTELMWTYTGQPVTQTQYGLWNDGVFGYIPVFETRTYTNITHTDPGASIFTPPSFCSEAELLGTSPESAHNGIFLF